MTITPSDFSKIWASNADTPEYTFNEADYLKGWDFVGNLPPTRAMWNAMQKSTDEKMKYVFDNFGAPLTASTVADMTMQNRVYVYTGSETGYTAGHWYYWNGSAWADGGVYNSNTVQVDPTLTISGAAADAQITGRNVNLTFNTISEKYINKNTGVEASSGSYVSSDYIGVKTAVWLYSFCGNDNSGYAFYDEAKTPLSYGAIYPFNRTWTKLTAPTGAKYFRATCGVNQASEFQIRLPVADAVDVLAQNDVSNTLNGITYNSGYITNNDGEIGALVPSTYIVSKKIPVTVGETYHINGVGLSSARLWSTHDSDGYTVRMADANKNAINVAETVTIADGERYLVYNTDSRATRYGITQGDGARSTFNTRDLIAENEASVDALEFSFKNNMSTDGADKLPKCKIYKNGTASPANYGLSGSRYVFSMPANKVHLYFEFKQTDAVPSISSDLGKRIVNAFRTGYFYVAFKGSFFQNTELFQRYSLNLVSGTNSTGLTPTSYAYKRLQGEDAFSVKYTNTISENSVGTITFNSDSVVVNVDGTTTTINVGNDTTVTDLVADLNAISGIAATVIWAEGKTYADLLPVVSKGTSTNTTVNLIYSGTLYDGTAYTDAPFVYIPLAVSDKWHSVEMIIDPDGYVSCAFDGLSLQVDYDTTVTPVINRLILNDAELPIVIRNLEIDYGSAGDAEVVDNLVDPKSTPGKQLISSHNPRLLIYEGHGIDVCADADAPISDSMACSTERLRILFDTAIAKGYTPVTWEQIIAWKKNGNPLPKRCFTLMFDDWRFSNYMTLDKRKPFVDYNIKPGLAVITDYAGGALTDEVTYDGVTYTVKDVVDITMRAGWYCASHTHIHRRMTDYTVSNTANLLRTDIIEAGRYGIHQTVLVYPYGDIAAQYMPVLAHSDFEIGVNITRNSYNCQGVSDFYLSRVEIGTRVPLSTVLYPLV